MSGYDPIIVQLRHAARDALKENCVSGAAAIREHGAHVRDLLYRRKKLTHRDQSVSVHNVLRVLRRLGYKITLTIEKDA